MNLKLSMLALFGALACGFGVSGPANATAAIGAPGAVKAAVNAETILSDARVEHVQYRHRDGRHHEGRRHWRGDRDHHWRRGDRRWDRRDRWDRRHYRSRPNVYFNFGLTTPRYVEPRYVRPRHVAPRRVVRLNQAHYNWCHAQYRSYRAYDNSFQPYNGPRRQCISPF